MADITLDTEAAPATPGSGAATLYFDSTLKRLASKQDGGLVSQYVDLDTAQTLTTKTLTAPTISNPTVTTGTFSSPALTTPTLGVATGTSLAVSGLLTSSSPSAGIGYATGAGGAVTQLTNRSTGVTVVPNPSICGAITTNNTSLAAGAEATFTVTNSAVAVGDVVVVCARSGQTAATSIPFVTTVAAGSFNITLSNFNASTADTGAMIINYLVLKAVSA